jgi:hypothetical protein
MFKLVIAAFVAATASAWSLTVPFDFGPGIFSGSYVLTLDAGWATGFDMGPVANNADLEFALANVELYAKMRNQLACNFMGFF